MGSKARNAELASLVSEALLRDVPGWPGAPVPACMGGDPRSLTFCCAPGFALSHGLICRRDALLEEVGLTPAEFSSIKDHFSKEHGWDDDRTCFKSLSYCCMRQGGCPAGRDIALAERNPGKSWDGVKAYYFSRKRLLSIKLLEACNNKDVVRPFIAVETDG